MLHGVNAPKYRGELLDMVFSALFLSSSKQTAPIWSIISDLYDLISGGNSKNPSTVTVF